MEHQNHDQVFVKNFGLVLGALGAIFAICVIAARMIVSDGDLEDKAAQAALLQERIQPVGQVVTDPAVLMKMEAAGKVARAAYTGEQVVQRACAGCHGSGMLGAPKTGDKAAWSARLSAAGGLDGLVASAIKGKNAMPPRGGDSDLSDDEVKAAVELLLK